MAGVFYYDGTDNDDLAVTNDENLMYYVAGASTPNAPFGAILTGVVRYTTQVKIQSILNRNHVVNSITYTEYLLAPVQAFADINGPSATPRTNTGASRLQHFRHRPFLWKYFTGWRFNRAMPAGTGLGGFARVSETFYSVPTARLAASTSYYTWPSDNRDDGPGGSGPFLFPDILMIPNSAGVTFAVNATVMTYAWSDTE